jgi:hypothetical protein
MLQQNLFTIMVPLSHLSNMNRNRVENALISIGISLAIACATYLLGGWFISSHSFMSRTDATFVEGIFFIFVGFLVLIGSGGITRNSQKAAMLASAAKAISHKDVIGPSEIFRKDAWKPKGYVRFGLVLMGAGAFLLVIYFLSVYIF